MIHSEKGTSLFLQKHELNYTRRSGFSCCAYTCLIYQLFKVYRHNNLWNQVYLSFSKVFKMTSAVWIRQCTSRRLCLWLFCIIINAHLSFSIINQLYCCYFVTLSLQKCCKQYVRALSWIKNMTIKLPAAARAFSSFSFASRTTFSLASTSRKAASFLESLFWWKAPYRIPAVRNDQRPNWNW